MEFFILSLSLSLSLTQIDRQTDTKNTFYMFSKLNYTQEMKNAKELKENLIFDEVIAWERVRCVLPPWTKGHTSSLINFRWDPPKPFSPMQDYLLGIRKKKKWFVSGNKKK